MKNENDIEALILMASNEIYVKLIKRARGRGAPTMLFLKTQHAEFLQNWFEENYKEEEQE